MLAASACLALACNNANAPQPLASQPAASPAANNAAPTPNQAAQHSEAQHSDEAKMPRLSAEESKKLVDTGKAVIIDVRGSEAYKLEHIKGALDIHLSDLEAGKFDKLPQGKRIIAYCT